MTELPFSQITCEVKARFTTLDLHPWSDTVAPIKPFFAGIKVGSNACVPIKRLGIEAQSVHDGCGCILITFGLRKCE